MAEYNLMTRSGHDFYEMSSLLQKSIRRGDYNGAGYAARELIDRYRKYLWKRLLVISAEDCYGIMTKEIIALKLADDELGKKDYIFVAKAIMLLCQAKKNRDACYFACNYMSSENTIDPEKIDAKPLDDCWIDRIPDYVFDVHTLRGKRRGKTIEDMIREEQMALHPKQIGLFDISDWSMYLTEERKRQNGK